MITRLQNYLEERWILKLLRKSAKEIATSPASIAEVCTKYTSGKKGTRKLLVYCILIISRDKTTDRPSARLNKVLREYLKALELAIELESINRVLSIQEQQVIQVPASETETGVG